MKPNIENRLAKSKRRIERRLDGARHDRGVPMLGSRGIRVEMSDRIQAIATGGIGLVHQLARQTGLIEAIDYSSIVTDIIITAIDSVADPLGTLNDIVNSMQDTFDVFAAVTELMEIHNPEQYIYGLITACDS